MKSTKLAAGAVALACVGLVGCKTTPKLAWWKGDKTAESTAVAHSAPTLPSDLATQGGAVQSSVAQAGGTAAPYSPSTVARASATAAPSSYPSTDAPPFTPDVASRIVSAPLAGATTTTPAPTTGSNLGSIAAGPYNPAMPPRATSTTPTTTTAPLAGRYDVATTGTAGTGATSSAPLYGQSAAGGVVAATGGAIGGAGSATATGSADALAGGGTTTNPTGGATGVVTTSTLPGYDVATGYGNRYNAAVTGAATMTESATGAVHGATAIATGQPYRPGGTSTYPDSTPRVATLPREATASGGATTGTTTPAPTVGGSAPTTTTPTSPLRYW